MPKPKPKKENKLFVLTKEQLKDIRTGGAIYDWSFPAKPKQEDWEKEDFNEEIAAIAYNDDQYIKIDNLLAKERHDHEILVNTILDARKEEIAQARKEGYEEGIKVQGKKLEKEYCIPKLKEVKKFWEQVGRKEDKIRQEVLSEVEKELPKELNQNDIIHATCSDYEVPCCGACPACDCHKEGTEKNEKWKQKKWWYERGKKIGKLEIKEIIKGLK